MAEDPMPAWAGDLLHPLVQHIDAAGALAKADILDRVDATTSRLETDILGRIEAGEPR